MNNRTLTFVGTLKGPPEIESWSWSVSGVDDRDWKQEELEELGDLAWWFFVEKRSNGYEGAGLTFTFSRESMCCNLNRRWTQNPSYRCTS